METKNIDFTDKLSDVIGLLLSLNNIPKFGIVKQINDNTVEIVYTGGYNGVYNHISIVQVLDFINHDDMWISWKFKTCSDLYDSEFEAHSFDDGMGSFMDFFIDVHIREVGNLLNDYDN